MIYTKFFNKRLRNYLSKDGHREPNAIATYKIYLLFGILPIFIERTSVTY